MTTDPSQQLAKETKQDDEQLLRLRGGGAFADCLA